MKVMNGDLPVNGSATLFLFAILITCRANEMSWSRQLNANSGHRRNNLNRGAYLDGSGGSGDRNVGRTAYTDVGESVYVGRTPNDNSYESRTNDPSRGNNVGAVTPLIGKLPSGTKTEPSAWRLRPNKGVDVGPAPVISNTKLIGKATLARASKVDKDTFVWNPSSFGNEPKEDGVIRQNRNPLLGRANGLDPATHIGSTSNIVQGMNVRTSDLKRAGRYGHGNYINRPDGLHQVDNVARINMGRTVPVVRDGNYINELNGISQHLNLGTTNHLHLDRSAPIVRAGSYSQETYVNNANGASQGVDVARGDLNYDINRSDSLSTEAQVSQHVYSHPDSEIESNQPNPYVPSFKNTADGNADKDINNISDRGSTGNLNKGVGVPSGDLNDGNGVLNDYSFPNDGHDAPYDGYGNPNHGSYIPNNSFGASNNRYVGLDYNKLAPDFDKFTDADVSSKNKTTNSALITAYNNNMHKNNDNSSITDKKPISNRGAIFDVYSVRPHLLHNSIVFSDDKHDDTSNNNGQMNSNGDCYCNTNNGQRVYTCNPNHITTTTTTCGICKVREVTTPKPTICDQCLIKETLPPPPPPPTSNESGRCKCGHSSCCKHSCRSRNSCSSKPKKPTCHYCDYSDSSGYGHHWGDNGYNDYNNYYNNREGGRGPEEGGRWGGGGEIRGGAGARVHAMADGGAWDGVYSGWGGQLTSHSHGASKNSGIGSSGGKVALYTDIISMEDTNPLLSSSKTCSASSSNSVQMNGGGSSAAGHVYSSSTGYGGGTAYKKFFNSFGNGGPFLNHIIHGGAIFDR